LKTRKIFLLFLAAAILLLPACKKVEQPEDTTADTTEEETTELENAAEPAYTHPLTGLACEKDLSGMRPVSIMPGGRRTSGHSVRMFGGGRDHSAYGNHHRLW